MSLPGTNLLTEAQNLKGMSYAAVRCHDLILGPFITLGMFDPSEKIVAPDVPDDVHLRIQEFDIKRYIDTYAERLDLEKFKLRWLDNFHHVEPGDILVLAIGDTPCHLGWAASPRGPVRHMLHSWNPDPSRPQLGSVRYDLIHPRVFSVSAVARIEEA